MVLNLISKTNDLKTSCQQRFGNKNEGILIYVFILDCLKFGGNYYSLL